MRPTLSGGGVTLCNTLQFIFSYLSYETTSSPLQPLPRHQRLLRTATCSSHKCPLSATLLGRYTLVHEASGRRENVFLKGYAVSPQSQHATLEDLGSVASFV